jgi:hypothetical protein
MEDFLIKNNFVGRDGFVWWVGQIATEGSWINNTKEAGWGNRYKVRIMGYHPYSTAQLKDEDLPWALVMLPPGVGPGGGMVFSSVKFSQGDVVVGFFLDGDDGQVPVIMGSFGNTSYRAPDGEQMPFGVFSGYGKSFKKVSDYVIANSETNEPGSAPGTQNVSPKVAATDPQGNGNKASTTSTAGYIISLACGDGEDDKANDGGKKKSKATKAIENIKDDVQRFTQWLGNKKAIFDENLEWLRDEIDKEIDDVAETITNDASKLVGSMVRSAMISMASITNKGIKMLYADVYAKTLAATGNPAVAHLAGVAAQNAMVPAVKAMQCFIECLVNQVLGKITSLVADILKSVANNVLNFVDCIADQTVGAIVNGIITLLNDGILPLLNGIEKILKFFEDFSFENLLRNGIDAILGLVGLRSCFKKAVKDKYGACKYMLGYGPVKQDEPDLSGILEGANAAKAASAAASVAGFPLDGVQDIVGAYGIFSDAIKDPKNEFLGDVDSCFAGIPTLCGPPKVNIFGGGGEGGAATALMGLLDENTNTGSVIDIQLTNPGNNYTFPPFVEVVDSCGQGYGCVARATIKAGKIDTIYVVSIGENYPVDEVLPYIVESVNIINPGTGYQDGDTVIDNQGNQYEVQVSFGSIIKVTPINSKDISDIPILEVQSDTGSGALLRANLGVRPDFQDEVKQVIDCVT